MALIVYSTQALHDFERVFEFAAADDASLAVRVVDAIQEAISILERHPLIGRPVEHGLRELLVSRGKTGYVALYRYNERSEVVPVLAIRHQREAGYGTIA